MTEATRTKPASHGIRFARRDSAASAPLRRPTVAFGGGKRTSAACPSIACVSARMPAADELAGLALASVGWSSHGSDQRQKYQDDSERRDVPYKGAQQKNPCGVQGEIDDATPKIELNTPLGHPTVRGRNMG